MNKTFNRQSNRFVSDSKVKDKSIKNKNGNYLIIGFMLSEDKLEILN